MSKKRFLSAALGVLLLLTVSAPGALALGETSAAPESEMSDVTSWSASSTSSSASILETYQVTSGTYRVETYYYVSGDGGYESGTVYSKTVTY